MTSALQDTDGTRLALGIAPGLAAHPGKTGTYALSRGRDAFAARVLLAGAAQRSLDVQYYIWHGDHTGLSPVRGPVAGGRARRARAPAAGRQQHRRARSQPSRRSMRTRTSKCACTTRCAHRSARWTNYVTDFSRVNRRMHNKSLTVDNQATVVGGRNIGDDYFAAGRGVAFADLDVIAVGPAVRRCPRLSICIGTARRPTPPRSSLGQATPATVRAAQGDLRCDARRSGARRNISSRCARRAS